MRKPGHWLTNLAVSLAVCGGCMGTAYAQQGNTAPAFLLELNRLEPQDSSCRVTLLAHNRLGGDLDKAGYEIVLFNEKGLVERMTVFDFGALPADKTLVRQFDVSGTDCSGISRILVNGASACSGKSLDPGLCASGLVTENKTTIVFGN